MPVYAADTVGKVKVKFSVDGIYDNGLPEVAGEADNSRYSLDQVTTLEEYMEQWEYDDDDDENDRKDNSDLLACNATCLAMKDYSEMIYAVTIDAAEGYHFTSEMDRITVTGLDASCVRLERLNDKETLVLFVKFGDLDDLAGTMDSAVWTAEWKASYGGVGAWYELRLYRNGSICGGNRVTGASGYDFRPLMRRSGSYYYQVRTVSASGENGEWLQSEALSVTEEMAADNRKQFFDGRVPGWQSLEDEAGARRYWYMEADGSFPQQNWLQVDGGWYFFDAEGYLMTSVYVKWGSDTYYVDENGRMITEGKAPDGQLTGVDGKLRWPES